MTLLRVQEPFCHVFGVPDLCHSADLQLTSVRIVVSYDGWYFSFSCGALFSIFSLSVFCFLSAPLGYDEWTQTFGSQPPDTEPRRLTPPEKRRPHLEHFDLAGSRVEVFCVFTVLVLSERVDLDPEWDALLSSVLPHGEFRADAVNLQKTKHTHIDAKET